MTHSPSLHKLPQALGVLLCLFSVALLASLSAPLSALADDEASNWPHVQSAEYGRCYLKSVPAENYGSKGQTYVYSVTAQADQLLVRYPWYSKQIWLNCAVSNDKSATGISVVRRGPWSRGHRASANDLALAFAFNGKEVKHYSTLDLAGKADNVSASVSHYTVIEKVLGYRWINSNEYVFEILLIDGRKLAFDPTTGERVKV
jgi:hypothetical protein